MSECKFCGTPIAVSNQNPKYNKCPKCLTHTLISNLEFDYSTYFDIYSHKHMVGILNSDKKHYDGFVPKIAGIREKKFDCIWSFGGGMPKLESYLQHDLIKVFDANAENYRELMGEFKNRFTCDPDKIIFEQAFITPDQVRETAIGSHDLVAFVHFLEHLDEDTFIGFIDAAADSGSSLMIYQPEINGSRSKNWFHFLDQHRTLVSVDMLKGFVADRGFQNIVAIKHSDDFFLYAEKNAG